MIRFTTSKIKISNEIWYWVTLMLSSDMIGDLKTDFQRILLLTERLKDEFQIFINILQFTNQLIQIYKSKSI